MGTVCPSHPDKLSGRYGLLVRTSRTSSPNRLDKNKQIHIKKNLYTKKAGRKSFVHISYRAHRTISKVYFLV